MTPIAGWYDWAHFMMKTIISALFAVLMFTAQGHAAERVALVIGIEKYQALSKLKNPVADAKAIAQILKSSNFQVFEYYDVARSDLLDAIENFKTEASKAQVALVYYAGHGLEVGGRNTIAPTDMEISCEAKQTRRAVELDKLFEAVQGTPQQVILLDACRNDPFPSCDRGGGGVGFRGFERVPPLLDRRFLLANSTLSGRLASDGATGAHSPFAAALLARFKTDSAVPIGNLLNDVARDVGLATDGNQTPEIVTRGGGPNICLAGSSCGGTGAARPATVVVAPPVNAGPSCSAIDADLAFQDAIRKNTAEGYREFLAKCPDDKRKETVLGLYGRLADEQLWQRISKDDTLTGYQQYEAAFPNGSYIELARRRASALRTAALTPTTPAPIPERRADPSPSSRDFIFANSDSVRLTRDMLAGLSAGQLRIARNEIYARRGRYFKDDSLTAHFKRFSWYQPYAWDPPLNGVEKANVALIQSMEH